MAKNDGGREHRYERILERLRKEAIHKFGTQVDFGVALFPSKSKPSAGTNISRLLRGESGWRLADFAEACHLLGVSADYILGLMPQETYAKVTGASGTLPTITIPYVECADLVSDASILQRGKAMAAARVVIDGALRHFYGDSAPREWEYGRIVMVAVEPCEVHPSGAHALVDRRPELDSFHGTTVAIDRGDGECVLGKLYPLGEQMLFTPLGGGQPRLLEGAAHVLGAVVLVATPQAAVD